MVYGNEGDDSTWIVTALKEMGKQFHSYLRR